MEEVDIRNVGKELLKLEGEELEQFVRKELYRRRNLKSGENVLHLFYYSFIIPESEVEEFGKILAEYKIHLSYADDTGTAKASAVNIISLFAFGQDLAQWVFENVSWDVIAGIFGKLAAKANNKLRSKTNDDVTALSIRYSKKGFADFYVPVGTEPALAEKAIKGIKQIIKTLKKEKLEGYARFRLNGKGKWEFIG